MNVLATPITEEEVRALRLGDTIYVTGTMVTARDEAHKKALYGKEQMPIDLGGLVLFHCGPVVRKKNGKWEIVAAGPTTSTRMDLFEDEFIEKFRVRVIVGKGGMGARTADAMEKYGCVYGAFTGGAAVLAAKSIKGVKDVVLPELGMPEAMWVLEVEKFGPLTIAIDAHGNNMFEDVRAKVDARKGKVYEMLGIAGER